MIEKVNPSHPDKVADRIAGALVDYAYTLEENPKCAFEVLIGHGECYIGGECSVELEKREVDKIVDRIADNYIYTHYNVEKQDKHLADNQEGEIRCGDNGIFKGVPLSQEEKEISKIARIIYGVTATDGKYILDGNKLIICQSHVENPIFYEGMFADKELVVNPLGYWTGGIQVDTGATNRKLGSDMARSITGGGLHGKDLSKADVSVNIYAFIKAQRLEEEVELSCAIGDNFIDGLPYSQIVEIARDFIKRRGGFEEFAEWGLF